MNNKNGFTLIELLAVIVILAVIALIVTPVITGIIRTAKESANKRSVEGHIKNVEYQILQKTFADSSYNMNTYDGTKSEEDLGFVYPSGDNIVCKNYVINNGNVLEASSCKTPSWNKEYSFKKGENVGDGVEAVPPKIGATVVPAVDKKYIAEIYLDPSNLENECNAEKAISTINTKTGCMKWYAYKQDDSSYTMILDHNSTALVYFNSNRAASSGSPDLDAALENDTNTWISEIKATARSITIEEIATAVDYTNFNSATATMDNYFTFGDHQTSSSNNALNTPYAFLFNNLYKSKKWGGTLEEDTLYPQYNNPSNYEEVYSYWTSSRINTYKTLIWHVDMVGRAYRDVGDYSNAGLRPVITISKSSLEV